MKRPLTICKIVTARFSQGTNPVEYDYIIAADEPLKVGDRIVVPNKASFSIPTVSAIYQADTPEFEERFPRVTDAIVQVVRTEDYQNLVAQLRD